MTVRDLIAFLETQDPDLPVAYHCYSEGCLLKADDIVVVEEEYPRKDGWIAMHRRGVHPKQKYLMLPGN